MTATVECPNCKTLHTGVPVERDECGVSFDLDRVPCQGSDTCTAYLCECCRVQCKCCGLYSCEEHVRKVDGEVWCNVCAAPEMVAEVAA